MRNKIFAIITVVALMFVFAVPAFAASSDQPSKWAQAEVAEAIQDGLVPANLQSDYQAPITRGEFAQLLVQTLFAKVKHDMGETDASEPVWKDAKEFLQHVTVDTKFVDADQDYIKVAYALGSINGVSDTEFAPNSLITRQEAATMLSNTIHMDNMSYYSNMIKSQYKDWDKIAKWAQAGVMVASINNLMAGTGTEFDYKGEFTREQSIATMVRFYKSNRYDKFSLRGNIGIYASFDEFSYNVGKNYVYVTYIPNSSATYHHTFNYAMYDNWHSWTSETESVLNKYNLLAAAEFSAFAPEVPRMKEIAIAAANNKAIKVDLGFMTYETKHNGHLAEFVFKDVPGYASLNGGYHYGFEKIIPVEPKVID